MQDKQCLATKQAMSESTNEPGEFDAPYRPLFDDVTRIIDSARRSAARSVDAAMTAAYWLAGKHIVEFERQGNRRADYGGNIIEQLANALSVRYGRGFSLRNVKHSAWHGQFCRHRLQNLPLPASLHVFRFLGLSMCGCYRSRTHAPVNSYEDEALQGGWSVRQLDRKRALKTRQFLKLTTRKIKLFT